MRISVVIPVHREEGIASLLDDLLRRGDTGHRGQKDGVEIIVVDGAPEGDTLCRALAYPVLGLASPPGRGVQLNAGAAAASGDRPVLPFPSQRTGRKIRPSSARPEQRPSPVQRS